MSRGILCKQVDIPLAETLILYRGSIFVSIGRRWPSHTMQFGNIDAESVSLFQNLLASLLNESIESVCEASHALT